MTSLKVLNHHASLCQLFSLLLGDCNGWLASSVSSRFLPAGGIPGPVLFELTIDLASIDLILNDLGALSVDLAADREGSTQDLLDGAGQSLGERLESHGPGNVDDLLKRDRLAVLDVLLLLAVTWGLLQGTDDEGGGGGDDGDGGLTVLDGELDRDTEALLYVCKNNLSA